MPASRLRLTFDTLAQTPIQAAVDVLIHALETTDGDLRRFALRALVSRDDARSVGKVLEYWDSLTPADIAVVREKKQNFAELVDRQIQTGDAAALTAIGAARELELTNSLLTMITQAESCRCPEIKRAAGEAVLDLVRPLGQRARHHRDLSTVRGPVLTRLLASIQTFSAHRNERLIEAFLVIAAWPDGDLRLLFDKPSTSRDLICTKLRKTNDPGAVELLAGYIRRRDLPQCIGQVIQSRSDEQFRDALLDVLTEETSSIHKNLELIGMPNCCLGGERIVEQIRVDQLPALATLYGIACSDAVEALQVLAAVAQRGGESCMSAVVIGMSRCETPDTDFWIRAAIPVAAENEDAIANNENARLMSRLIELLNHSDGAVVRSIRQVLAPLTVDKVIDRIEKLRPRSRRRLGKIVLKVDSEAIARVHDALRHPVLAKRLNAIALAESLACIDEIAESLAHVIRQDHQDARIRAAQAMASATSESTMQLLQELTNLPECGVRDAAIEAIEQRNEITNSGLDT